VCASAATQDARRRNADERAQFDADAAAEYEQSQQRFRARGGGGGARRSPIPALSPTQAQQQQQHAAPSNRAPDDRDGAAGPAAGRGLARTPPGGLARTPPPAFPAAAPPALVSPAPVLSRVAQRDASAAAAAARGATPPEPSLSSPSPRAPRTDEVFALSTAQLRTEVGTREMTCLLEYDRAA